MMEHIKSIDITAFRGITSLKLEDLFPINILTGDNNCGKTSVLEVLESYEDPGDFRFGWTKVLRKENGITAMGGLPVYEGFCDLFDADRDEKSLEYTIETENGSKDHIVLTAQEDQEEMTVEEYAELSGLSYVSDEEHDPVFLSVPKLSMEVRVNKKLLKKYCVYEGQRRFHNPPRRYNGKEDQQDRRNVLYISPTRHAAGNIFLSSIMDNSSLYQDMLEILKEYDRDIISINYDRDEKSISGQGIYKILSRSHRKALPLNVYGDGMKKAILLMSAVVRAKGGILLLDEFETAIHTSAMDKTFQWILETCIKLNVQVFLTSHSKEAIDKVLRCSPDLQDKIAVYTLYKDDQKTTARRLTGKKALVVQDDMGLELR